MIFSFSVLNFNTLLGMEQKNLFEQKIIKDTKCNLFEQKNDKNTAFNKLEPQNIDLEEAMKIFKNSGINTIPKNKFLEFINKIKFENLENDIINENKNNFLYKKRNLINCANLINNNVRSKKGRKTDSGILPKTRRKYQIDNLKRKVMANFSKFLIIKLNNEIKKINKNISDDISNILNKYNNNDNDIINILNNNNNNLNILDENEKSINEILSILENTKIKGRFCQFEMIAEKDSKSLKNIVNKKLFTYCGTQSEKVKYESKNSKIVKKIISKNYISKLNEIVVKDNSILNLIDELVKKKYYNNLEYILRSEYYFFYNSNKKEFKKWLMENIKENEDEEYINLLTKTADDFISLIENTKTRTKKNNNIISLNEEDNNDN